MTHCFAATHNVTNHQPTKVSRHGLPQYVPLILVSEAHKKHYEMQTCVEYPIQL